MQKGIKLVYVFDGKSPDLKQKEKERRKEIKIFSEQKYEEAKINENVDEMKKYAARTSRLDKEMIEESNKSPFEICAS